MRPAPLPLRHEEAFLNELRQSQGHDVGLAFCEFHNVAEREVFVIGQQGDDLQFERVELGDVS